MFIGSNNNGLAECRDAIEKSIGYTGLKIWI